MIFGGLIVSRVLDGLQSEDLLLLVVLQNSKSVRVSCRRAP